MTRTCASAITSEMTDWVKLGGGNSGCCGNSAHRYGFHLPANELPAKDYSRSHESAKPYNMSYCCAGDFGHSGNTRLRAMHATVLARLMQGDPKLSMICEFIGMPYVGKPVYYWAVWNGRQTLKKYTGSGHDTWSHISWWRSKANQRAYLWTPAGSTPSTPGKPAANTTESTKPSTAAAPAYPGYDIEYNPDKVDANLKVWQRRMQDRDWTLVADGIYGPEMQKIVIKFQREKRLTVDGIIGRVTWAAAWTSPVT